MMPRMIFSLMLCLGLAGSSQATFFTELWEQIEKKMLTLANAAEAIAHDYKSKHKEHKDGLPEEVAKELDKKLAMFKHTFDSLIKGVHNSHFLSEKSKTSIIERLTKIKNKLFHEIDATQETKPADL